MTSLTINLRASAAYELAAETPLLLMVEPPGSGHAHSLVSEQLLTSPTISADVWIGDEGNFHRRLIAPAGIFTFDYTATVEAAPGEAVPEETELLAPAALPPETFAYLRPSRYCPSDRFGKLAADLFGGLVTGGATVNAIAAWVHKSVTYQYGTSDAQTTALDTLVERVGVCRDFAHLTIAFCRALEIPARYLSGYALGLTPCDFHAWVQVYVGGEWRNVDATFEGVRPAFIPIGIGRDAADIAMMTFFGDAKLQSQSVTVWEANGPSPPDRVDGEPQYSRVKAERS